MESTEDEPRDGTAADDVGTIDGIGTVRVLGPGDPDGLGSLPTLMGSCLEEESDVEAVVVPVREDRGESMSNGWSSRSSVESRSWSGSWLNPPPPPLTFLTVEADDEAVVEEALLEEELRVRSLISESDVDDGGGDEAAPAVSISDMGCSSSSSPSSAASSLPSCWRRRQGPTAEADDDDLADACRRTDDEAPRLGRGRTIDGFEVAISGLDGSRNGGAEELDELRSLDARCAESGGRSPKGEADSRPKSS